MKITPTILDYEVRAAFLLACMHFSLPALIHAQITAKNNSLFYTPPCHAIYITGLVYEWVLSQGGVAGTQFYLVS